MNNLRTISEQVGNTIRPYVIPFVIILAIVIPINLAFQSNRGLLSSCWSSGGGSAASFPYQPAASLPDQPTASLSDQPAAPSPYQLAAPPPYQPAAPPPDQPLNLGWAQAVFPGMNGNDAALICRAEEDYWENLVLRREACNGTLYPLPETMTNMTMKTLLLIPTYSCPANERIGKWGDGGKWTCLLPGAIQTDPVVYSIGSFGQYDFEDAIYKILHVQPHTFDPFLHPSTAAHMQTVPSLIFHPIGLSANSSLQYNRQKFSGAEFMTLGGIMQLLNHTYVDIFKIDCEGCEEALIAEFGEANGNASAQLSLHGGTLPFGQILIEIHQTNKPESNPGLLSSGWRSGEGSAASLPYQPPSLGWAAFLFPSMSGIDAAICRAEENYWENLVLRRKACKGMLYPPPVQYTPVLMKTVLLIPTYPCPANERIGEWGDGGKWTCMLPGAIQKDPVVYSIGSFGQYSFEDSIYKLLHVQPHTFDPFLVPATAARMQNLSSLHFHPIGLSAASELQNYTTKFPTMQFMTLEGIMQLLNHTYVDVFKIDCEGCEEALIPEIGEANGNAAAQLSVHGGTLPFGQILVEFHK
ncbi:unnamed protein product [Closterium sp. Naga37s-1]|nr:unnamed protein product [Closterium sp. Naga37s-1]